jgi:hypothetical protein
MDQPGEAFQPERPPQFQQGVQPADKSFTIITEGDGGNAFGGRGGGRGGNPFEDSTTTTDSARANDPYARMQPMARPPYGSITKPENPGRFDGRHVTEMTYKSNNAGFVPGPATAPRVATPRPAQLFIRRPDGSTRKQLTNTNYSHRSVAVSPDGKWIAFIGDPTLRPDSVVTAERDSIAKLPPDRKRDEMDRNETDIYLLPVAACESQSAECKPRKIEAFGTESDLTFSPDSKRLAFVGRPARFKNARLYVVDLNGGKPQDVLGTWK